MYSAVTIPAALSNAVASTETFNVASASRAVSSVKVAVFEVTSTFDTFTVVSFDTVIAVLAASTSKAPSFVISKTIVSVLAGAATSKSTLACSAVTASDLISSATGSASSFTRAVFNTVTFTSVLASTLANTNVAVSYPSSLIASLVLVSFDKRTCSIFNSEPSAAFTASKSAAVVSAANFSPFGNVTLRAF